jgi:hypothetical protein
MNLNMMVSPEDSWLQKETARIDGSSVTGRYYSRIRQYGKNAENAGRPQKVRGQKSLGPDTFTELVSGPFSTSKAGYDRICRCRLRREREFRTLTPAQNTAPVTTTTNKAR